jgi:hypothetical protein
MKIIHTFVQGLYAFKYSDEALDELERLLDEWNDIEMLRKFFEENCQDLKYFRIDVDDAIIQTRKEVNALLKRLIDLSKTVNPDLDSMFANLDDYETRIVELAKQKSKRRWLRIYALRIDTNTYIITGGAIKLTLEMKDRLHTLRELDKLESCRNYLKDQGVFDIASFNELDI